MHAEAGIVSSSVVCGLPSSHRYRVELGSIRVRMYSHVAIVYTGSKSLLQIVGRVGY
jgi:hypothetical protein